MIQAAEIHMSKEKVDEAEEVLEEIRKINPNTVNIYNSLGVLYRKKGEYKKALYNYKKAIVIHPDRGAHSLQHRPALYRDERPRIRQRVFLQSAQAGPRLCGSPGGLRRH